MGDSDMDAETEAKFRAWIAEKWKGDGNCPLCGVNQWAVGEIGEIQGYGGIKRHGSIYPVAVLVCGNCGNTIMFSAILAGLVPNVVIKEGKA